MPSCKALPLTSTIMSSTFLGQLWETRTSFNWNLDAELHQYIVLQFIDFDIGCDTNTELKVWFYNRAATQILFCNLNKPVYPIVSDLNIINVHLYFKFEFRGSHVFPEGFRGIFRVGEKERTASSLATSEEECRCNYFAYNAICKKVSVTLKIL